MSITWTAELGAHASVGTLASHLRDLDTAMQLGERWGLELAREAAFRLLLNQIEKEGPNAIEGAAYRLGYGKREVRDLDYWLHAKRLPGGRLEGRGDRPYAYWYPDPTTLLRAIADADVPELLGSPPQVSRATYKNPLDITVYVSGIGAIGVVKALKLVRDWSNERARGKAEAEKIRAEALKVAGEARKVTAEAEGCELDVEIRRLILDQQKKGGATVPAGELFKAIAPGDVAALSRLAERHIELRLPEGSDQRTD